MRERLDPFLDDIRLAARGLARRPGFTLVAVLTLAIGIGANTAIYSAVDALLLRSLPFPEPARLMDVALVSPEDGAGPWSFPKYAFFHDHQKRFPSLALRNATQTTLTGTDPERVTIESVTANYLTTLGVRVATGADFPREVDAGPNARKVAIISDGLWQRRFNADAHIAGQVLPLDNKSYEIIAIASWGTPWLSVLNPQETLTVQGLDGGIGAAGFEAIHLDARALAFTFLVTVAVGLLFGLVPALHAKCAGARSSWPRSRSCSCCSPDRG